MFDKEAGMMRAILALAASSLWATLALADPALDALVAAYPDHLAGYDEKDLVWKDGTRMPISDGRATKTFEQLLDEPDIKDQFKFPYPLGPEVEAPAINADPGRIRNEKFFTKMYGDCHKGEVTKRLKQISWMPGRGGGKLSVTSVNEVNERLAAVVKDLDILPTAMTKFLVPSAGTYNCRVIKNTTRLSVHAYAAAVDINDRQADYWEFLKGAGGQFTWRNRVPGAIGDIFERHGFIWGAKWFHVDSMHFEYRPELIMLAKAGWPKTKPPNR
jgi:hypothetical protein